MFNKVKKRIEYLQSVIDIQEEEIRAKNNQLASLKRKIREAGFWERLTYLFTGKITL